LFRVQQARQQGVFFLVADTLSSEIPALLSSHHAPARMVLEKKAISTIFCARIQQIPCLLSETA